MKSIWSQSCQIRARQSLPQDRKSEVAVIGAGMAGVLIAHALQQAGHQVIVLEADRIGSGQTRNTTAKITSQHGMIYDKLIGTLGKDRAMQYATANETAIRAYRDLITAQGIDCDFEEQDAYVYGSNEKLLRAEAGAAARLGIPATFVRTSPLPVPMAGAVRFAHQAQFHPLKFLSAVSEELTIYEHTPVRSVDGDLIVTEHGTVQAEHIVFACHYPFINFFLKNIPEGDLKAEYLLPIIMEGLLKENKATVSVLETHDKWFGITYAADKDKVIEEFKKLVGQGVYPSPLNS